MKDNFHCSVNNSMECKLQYERRELRMPHFDFVSMKTRYLHRNVCVCVCFFARRGKMEVKMHKT